jgi:hypothetical protein
LVSQVFKLASRVAKLVSNAFGVVNHLFQPLDFALAAAIFAAELADFAWEDTSREPEDAFPRSGQVGPKAAISLSCMCLASIRLCRAFLTLETCDFR